MKFVKLFMALVGLALVFIFCKDNDTKVVIRFLDYQSPEIYLFLLIMTTFVLGMIAASFANTIKIIQLKRQLKQLQPEGAEQDKHTKPEKKNRKARKQELEEETKSTTPEPKNVVEQAPAVVEETPATPVADEVSDAVYEDPAAESAAEETPEVIELPQGPVDEPQTDKQAEDESQPKHS